MNEHSAEETEETMSPQGSPLAHSESQKVHGRPSGPAWRQFAREVGIVVLGVALALGAEQIAHAVDDAGKADETRAIAMRELGAGFGNAQIRLRAQACTLRRIDEIAALITNDPQSSFNTPRWIGRPPFAEFVSAGWDAASQAGRTALLGDDERTHLGGAYDSLHRLDGLEQQEQATWALLRQLEGAPKLDPMMLASVRPALQQARLLAWQARVAIVQGFGKARKAGVSPQSSSKITSSVCLPMTTSRAAATAQMNALWGDDLGEP
jgi:hypothetical protein